MNRKAKRTKASVTKKAVRGIAKRAGVAEPTADEKDPAFLALQVRALTTAVEALTETQRLNLDEIGKAFQLVDMHQYVLMRIVHDISENKELDVRLDNNDKLDTASYYAEYRNVVTQSGRNADLAAALWSKGVSADESIQRAHEQDLADATDEPVDVDDSYEIENFGGNNGKDS